MPLDVRKHEVNFCSQVSKWADKHFEIHPEIPFGSSEIEEYGRGTRKRADLRVYGRVPAGKGKLLIGGEVKLPGTPLGRSPFDPALMWDAFEKATLENCPYFFTWNVEELALFDRAIWDAPTMHERLVGHWKLGLRLNRPSDISQADVQQAIFSEFLPKVVADWGRIVSGQRTGDFSLAPAEFYIAVLESHLTGPAGPLRELYDYLLLQSDKDKRFDLLLREWMVGQQWNFDRKDPDSWHEAVERAAESMVYVLSNRILFYQAVRLRNRLPKLDIPAGANTPTRALATLKRAFKEAVEATGDYEPVFFPDADEDEWAALTALSGANSIESWRKFIAAVEEFRFKEIPTDVLGGVYQKLISPEERHKFGQHYTDENIIDVINAFCIGRRAGPRRGDDVVLDPACGSGSFLVRAYYRKAFLDGLLGHEELLEQLYGCDINPFPAHLATLNLAARNITNKENYPRIARKNFFLIRRDSPQFCVLPKATRYASGERERQTIELPELDAVIGNPPYVRQELIPRQKDKGVIKDQTKEYIAHAAELAFPELKLSGQSDLHTYFWPIATQFLKEGGWFGFLTSSSWLDVRYGFALQEWTLRNFRLVTVLESIDEPWFEDARVKTAVTILQRCSDTAKRDANLVRFVRFKQPLTAILGERNDEEQKQLAAEELRNLILSKKNDYSTDQLRIVVKKQAELWEEGIALGEMFARQKALAAALNDAGADEEDENGEPAADDAEQQEMDEGDYGGGKWGRYLRAPDFYFEIMREFGDKFVRLGDVATIKFGIKSGCDAFFMPRDVSSKMLEKYPSELEWILAPFMRRPNRSEVASGKVLIIQAGDKTLHPIERKYIRPELHSLMNVDRPVVRVEDLNRVVLWVSGPLEEIKGTYAYDYIRWGEKRTFASKKSKAVPVPKRSTCIAREHWYDVTGLEPGFAFWPMAQQYRHIIAENPDRLSCNHNLFDVHPIAGGTNEVALTAILNSTVVALFKTFYGRYAGTEGNLKTEVIDALALEVPNPALASPEIAGKLASALKRMQARESSELLEERLRKCHTSADVRQAAKEPLELPAELRCNDRRDLDDAVLEMLGVASPKRRLELSERLYREITAHNRNIRIIEVQKMEQRRKTGADRISQMELALDAWEHLEAEWRVPLPVWLQQSAGAAKTVELPEGDVRLPAAENFLEATTLFFGKKPGRAHECTSRVEAELLYRIAGEGLRGPVSIPSNEAEAIKLLAELEERLAEGRRKLMRLAEERAGSEKLREQVIETLYRWFIHGITEVADATGA